MRTTNPDDIMLNFVNREAQRAAMAREIILNTSDDLERPVLDAMPEILPRIYTVGPLSLFSQSSPLASIKSNLWKEDSDCLDWLDRQKLGSVVYVNFGSITVNGHDQRPVGGVRLGPGERQVRVPVGHPAGSGEGRQRGATSGDRGGDAGAGEAGELVPAGAGAVARGGRGFLTHSGWNSTIQSINSEVAMLCWPFFAKQQTSCWYTCAERGST